MHSRIVPTLGRRAIGSLRPSDVQEWVNKLGADKLSPSRIRQAHVVLSQALEGAVADNKIARNPARGAGIKLPRIARVEAPYLEPAQVARIARKTPEPYDLFVRLLGTLGLRFGEAAALRRRHVDPLGRRLLVESSLAEIGGERFFGATKTHATRRVPLTASLAAEMTEHLERHVAPEREALVFTSPMGSPLSYSNFRRRIWRPALVRAKLPKVGVHVLRHSAAAAMIHSGASPKTVQTVLGHASAAFTLTVYGHLFDADLDALAVGLEALVRAPKTGRRRDEDGTAASEGRLHSV